MSKKHPKTALQAKASNAEVPNMTKKVPCGPKDILNLHKTAADALTLSLKTAVYLLQLFLVNKDI